jgi:hypothetical protein
MSIDALGKMRTIAQVIQQSTAVNDYVQAKYSKSITCYIGLDPDQLPPESEHPLFIIATIDRSEKGDTPGKFLALAVGVGIVNESGPVESAPDPTTGAVLKEFQGIIQVEELRKIVETEILRIRGIGAKLDISTETILENNFPIFRSSSELTLEFPISRRSGRI